MKKQEQEEEDEIVLIAFKIKVEDLICIYYIEDKKIAQITKKFQLSMCV